MRYIFLCIGLLWAAALQAQSNSPEVVATAGDVYQGSMVQLDWTLGELATAIHQSSGQQVTEGFHQPSYHITSVQRSEGSFVEARVFPNPVTARLEVQMQLLEEPRVIIQISDSYGRLVKTFPVNSSPNRALDLTDLTAGLYFLSIYGEGDRKLVQTFKIQKIN